MREVSPFSTFVFNMAGQPTAIFLAVSIFFVLGVYPGGSIWLGFAMAFVGVGRKYTAKIKSVVKLVSEQKKK